MKQYKHNEELDQYMTLNQGNRRLQLHPTHYRNPY